MRKAHCVAQHSSKRGGYVIEVVGVPSDSDEVPCFPSLASLAPVHLLTLGACVFRVVRSGLFLKSAKAFAPQVAHRFHERTGKTCCSSRGDLFGEGSGMSAPE